MGSSSTKKFGIAAHITANATLDFCPPEREFMVCRARLPLMPKLPSIRLYSSIGLPAGVSVVINSFLIKGRTFVP